MVDITDDALREASEVLQDLARYLLKVQDNNAKAANPKLAELAEHLQKLADETKPMPRPDLTFTPCTMTAH
jgi:hypothetical protein